MTNKDPEKELVDKFKDIIINSDSKFQISNEINFNCRSKKYADIEYQIPSGELLVIEAKTHKTSNASNSAHILFGDLLKETGRKRDYANIIYGLLIPKDNYNKKNGDDFYRDSFNKIDKCIYQKFGEIIPVSYVFVCDNKKQQIEVYSWMGFYNNSNSLTVIK